MEIIEIFNIIIGVIAIVLASYIPLHNRHVKNKKIKMHKNIIQENIYDAEVIFSNVASRTNGYDYVEVEETSERIAIYTKKNINKIEQCMQDIKQHSMFLELDENQEKEIKGILKALDWFIDFYECDDKPTVKENAIWKKGKNELNDKIDNLLNVAENM